MTVRAAAVLSVGEEILAGDIVDRNAAEIAQALRAHGFRVRRIRCEGDDAPAIAAAVRELASAADLVIVTGGLGPTKDDRTREALAAAAGDALVEDAAALAQITAWFARAGRPMSESNRLQALRPESAEILENAMGTAPGLRLALGSAQVFSLPGVPVEMRHMLAAVVLPWLAARLAAPALPRALVHGSGLPESVVGERLSDLMDPVAARGRGIDVGVTVHGGTFTVSVTAAGAGEADVRAVAAEVVRRLGDRVFGRGDDTLEGVVVRGLIERRLTVATAESCTGGLVAQYLTSVPGSSSAFVEGIVAYANEVKIRRLGVDPELLRRCGAVSGEVAERMARGAADGAGARRAVSVTGIAGPTGGSTDKPVGTVWFGLFADGAVRVERHHFPGDRRAVRIRAARTALDLLRRSL